jgi:hypothetical protein
MNFKPASLASVAVFVGIVAFVVIAFLWAVHHAGRDAGPRGRTIFLRTTAFTATWLLLVCAVVASGAMLRMPFAGLPLFFGAVLTVSVAVGLSPLGGRMAALVPLTALVGFQAFRLPLELVLHAWGEQGTIPLTMTWRGRNWDIVSGLVALAAMPFASRHRAVAWIANLVGGALLLNVLRVAVMSSPLPFAWQVTPPLLLALNLPYALIGPVCVGGALIGHLVLTRALLRRG